MSGRDGGAVTGREHRGALGTELVMVHVLILGVMTYRFAFR